MSEFNKYMENLSAWKASIATRNALHCLTYSLSWCAVAAEGHYKPAKDRAAQHWGQLQLELHKEVTSGR